MDLASIDVKPEGVDVRAPVSTGIKGDYLSSKLGTATGNKLIITGTLKFEEQYTVRFLNKFNHIRQLHTITRPVFF